MAALTQEQWFEKLNGLFTARVRERWQDRGSVRPDDLPTKRNEMLDLLWSYYVGDAPLPSVAEEYEDIFKRLMRKARCNYAPMCVEAMLDRMELQAVSTELDSTTNGDDVAAEILENSGVAVKDILMYLFAMGEAFGMAVPTGDSITIHAIDPRRCVGIPDPDNPNRLRAALVKSYDMIEDRQVAHLFLPGEKWTLSWDGTKWKRESDTAEAIDNLDALGGIPIVRFVNKNGLGEYEQHIDVLDRINDTTLTRMVITKFQAFKQRGVSGDEDEDEFEDNDDDTMAQEDKDWDKVFKAGPGSVWKVPQGWQFWESSATDISPLNNAKRDDVKEFAAVTFTPLYLISPDDANGSASGADLLRESLTSKCRDRRGRVTPQMTLLWKIVFAMAGETPRGNKVKLNWGPIEFRSLAEKGDASTKAQGTLSKKRILEDVWEMSPQDIADNMNELAAEQLLLGATPVNTGSPTGSAPVNPSDVPVDA